MGLARYRQKRDFKETPEPPGRDHKRTRPQLSFVIQKHDASRLHYDFRLEMEGVLKSWAVPKGLPMERGEKRLAMEVEDHPIEYGTFEGTIPEGNYGAGTVMLWDRGTYEAVEADPLKALKAGKLQVILHGEKLKGEWHLVRMRGREREDKRAWLLIKSGDTHKPLPTKKADRSVTSGRTMDEIAGGKSRVWKSNRPAVQAAARIVKPDRAVKRSRPSASRAVSLDALRDLPRAPAKFVEPMKAVLVDEAPKGSDWLFEIKWDGYRALTVSTAGRIEIFSRTGRNVTGDFPDIARAVGQIPVATFVIDGEIVALDQHGRPSFQLLQKHKQTGGGGNLYYYLFDLINLENHSFMELPLVERKQRLKKLLDATEEPLRFSAAFQGSTEALLEHARKNRIEGIIGKQADSVYQPGHRGKSWVKIKIVCEQEFIVGGYTEPKGSRKHFGAVLVGYYAGTELRFASKVGTGFDEDTLNLLFAKFKELRTNQCPFNRIEARPASRGGLTPAEKRRCTWIKPELVCQVKFAEWTQDGGLRQPVFLGLRDDKPARDVVREQPVETE